MDFISSIFNPIVQLLEFILGIFHDFLSTVGLESYGVAIIVLTIIIKNMRELLSMQSIMR